MRMYLIANGVPYDVAFAVEEERALAMWVTLGEFNGGKWNWAEMAWEPRRH